MYITSINSIDVHYEESLTKPLDINSTFSGDLGNLLLTKTDKMQQQLDLLKAAPKPATVDQVGVALGVLNSLTSSVCSHEIVAYAIDIQARESTVDILERTMGSLEDLDNPSLDQYIFLMKKFFATKAAITLGINVILENPDRAPPADQLSARYLEYDVDINEKIPENLNEMYKQNALKIAKEFAEEQIARMELVGRNFKQAMMKKLYLDDIIYIDVSCRIRLVLAKLDEKKMGSGKHLYSVQGDSISILSLPKNFCPSMYFDEFSDCTTPIEIYMTTSLYQTRTYSKTSHLVSKYSSVVEVEIYSNGKLLPENNNKYPVIVTIPHINENKKDEFIRVNVSDEINSRSGMVYHFLNVTNPKLVYLIEIEQTTRQNLIILVGRDRLPTLDKYSQYFFIQSNDTENKIFLESSKTGIAVLGIGKLQNSYDNTNPKNNQLDKYNLANYNIRIFQSGCYYFDVSDHLWRYTNDLIATKMNISHTVCQTPLFAEISSGFNLAPAEFDGQLIYALNGEINTWTIYITYTALTLLYILLIIWGYFKDKSDKLKLTSMPIYDNKPNDVNVYEIVFITGPDSEASCESNISFIAAGECAESGIRKLPPPHDNLYRRYYRDRFVFTCPNYLGPIHKLRIIHDNKGRPPYDSWQLARAIIYDFQSHSYYVFETDSWLCLDRNKCSIDKTFKCSKNGVESLSFSRSFYYEFNKSVNTDHMWISIFFRDPGSRFCRKERIYVSAVYVYLTSLLFALYLELYGSNDDFLYEILIFKFSFNDAIAALCCSIILYPLIMMNIFILNRAIPKVLINSLSLQAMQRQKCHQYQKLGYTFEEAETRGKPDATNDVYQNKIMDTRYVVPWWTRYFVLVSSGIIILTSLGTTCYLSLSWQEYISEKWITLITLSFLLSFFVLESIRMLIIPLLSICGFYQSNVLFEDIDYDEKVPCSNTNISTDDDDDVNKTNDLYMVKGVLKNKVKEKHNEMVINRETKFLAKGVIIYCGFLLILFIITTDRMDRNRFHMQNHLEAMFIKLGDPFIDLTKEVSVLIETFTANINLYDVCIYIYRCVVTEVGDV